MEVGTPGNQRDKIPSATETARKYRESTEKVLRKYWKQDEAQKAIDSLAVEELTAPGEALLMPRKIFRCTDNARDLFAKTTKKGQRYWLEALKCAATEATVEPGSL